MKSPPSGVMGEVLPIKKRARLYIYNIKEDELTPITDHFTNVSCFNLNKDKSQIVLIANSFIDKMRLSNDLYIYYIEEKHLEKK